MNNTEKNIREAVVIAAGLSLNPEEVRADKHLVYYYGFNSLTYQVLILELEKRLNIIIPEEDYKTGYFHSVEGILMYISILS